MRPPAPGHTTLASCKVRQTPNYARNITRNLLAGRAARMRRFEALTDPAQPRLELALERRRPVTLQQLAQIPVDARIQVGVGPARGAQWHVGSEIAALPQVLA